MRKHPFLAVTVNKHESNKVSIPCSFKVTDVLMGSLSVLLLVLLGCSNDTQMPEESIDTVGVIPTPASTPDPVVNLGGKELGVWRFSKIMDGIEGQKIVNDVAITEIDDNTLSVTDCAGASPVLYRLDTELGHYVYNSNDFTITLARDEVVLQRFNFVLIRELQVISRGSVSYLNDGDISQLNAPEACGSILTKTEIPPVSSMKTLDIVENPETYSSSFMMGCNPGDAQMNTPCNISEAPIHRIEFTQTLPDNTIVVRNVVLGVTEVTHEQYRAYCDAAPDHCAVTESKDPHHYGHRTHPAIRVSWNNVQDYLRWLNEETWGNYRLPSEAEWEYAARNGDIENKLFYWGNNADGNLANGSEPDWADGFEHTSPVSSFSPNPWGLYDMHGNVWEWVEDGYHRNYTGAPTDGRAWHDDMSTTCDDALCRVIRGGSYSDGVSGLHSAIRISITPTARAYNIGFRLAQN